MSILHKIKGSILNIEYATHRKSYGSKILYYHDINDFSLHDAYTNMATSLEMFKKHLVVIKECGFEIVDKITEPEGQVLIGLDDGWAGIYEIKDFLLENQIHPTISIAPGLLDLDGYLSKEQVKVLHSLGFTIAVHSWTHQSLNLYNNNEKELKRELSDCRDSLEQLLSTKLDIFCYPQGVFSSYIYKKTLENGYNEIWSVVDGDYNDEVLPKVKKRCLVQFSSPEELKWILYGANRIIGAKHLRSSFIM